MAPDASSLPGRLEAIGRLLENTLLAVTLVALILLAAGQILLRNVFDTGFVWSDELLRLLLLWLAMIGAVAASRQDKHIKIDVLSRFLSPRLRLASQAVTALFASCVCGLIAWHAFRFVAESREFGDVVLVNAPAWLFQAVLPVGFALIAYHYAVLTLACVTSLLRRGADS